MRVERTAQRSLTWGGAEGTRTPDPLVANYRQPGHRRPVTPEPRHARPPTGLPGRPSCCTNCCTDRQHRLARGRRAADSAPSTACTPVTLRFCGVDARARPCQPFPANPEMWRWPARLPTRRCSSPANDTGQFRVKAWDNACQGTAPPTARPWSLRPGAAPRLVAGSSRPQRHSGPAADGHVH